MTRIWSHRPELLHLGLFVAAYILGCGFAQALAIVPGTGISIWPPSGLFIATLIFTSRNSWPWWVSGGLLAELASNIFWFHNPLPVAVFIYTGNALEALVGAWLVTWACGQPVRLETLREVLAVVLLGAGTAPLISATVGSATLAWFGTQTFAGAWPLFWLGDATGVLIVAPMALVVFQNWRSKTQFSSARWVEACVLGLIFLGVAALSLSGHLATAYVVLPPLLWAAVRFGQREATSASVLISGFAVWGAIHDRGPFSAGTVDERLTLLGVFMAVAQLLIILAYQHATASQIAPFNYSVVIFSGLIGWIVWHNTLDWISGFGILLVCAGGILSILLAPEAKACHGVTPVHGHPQASLRVNPAA